jgi:hypothetical protein
MAASNAANAAIQQNQNTAAQQQQLANAAQLQQYNQNLGAAQFGNSAATQDLQTQLALRNQPLNEITGLMSGSQLQMPQFQGYNPTSIAPAPVFAGAQAQGAADMQRYGIQQSGANATTSGLFSLAGAAMSDRRLKSNIERIGTHKLWRCFVDGCRRRGCKFVRVVRHKGVARQITHHTCRHQHHIICVVQQIGRGVDAEFIAIER